VEIVEAAPIPIDDTDAYLAIMAVEYHKGAKEQYFLPLALAVGERADRLPQHAAGPIVGRAAINSDGKTLPGLVFDGLYDDRFTAALLEMIQRRKQLKGVAGDFVGVTTKAMSALLPKGEKPPSPTIGGNEQSNTSIHYGNRLIGKAIRRLDEGVNPDFEVGRTLTDRGHLSLCPRTAGALEYVPAKGEPFTLVVLHEFVPNEGNAWNYTLDEIRSYMDHAKAQQDQLGKVDPPLIALADAAEIAISERASSFIGPYLQTADRLGSRTAEMHVALAAKTTDPAFSPEPFLPLDQRALYQSIRGLSVSVLQLLRQNLASLSETVRADAARVIESESTLQGRVRTILKQKASGLRIRIHGDYHLGQVLYTGRDFVIIDFEGEPTRPISERRLKRLPMRDVAGMLRSFHYAAETVLGEELAEREGESAKAAARQAAALWYAWTCVAFLRGYLRQADRAPMLPKSRDEFAALLDAYLIEKALYEVRYELNSRPAWVGIPVRGLLDLLFGPGTPA
jgi:maltose alpha-D-glucosyltransferase/alpha-amylase